MSEFVDDEMGLYPASESYSGNNAFYVDTCDAIGYRPAYAVCLKKLKAIEGGSIAFPECVGARCEAAKMRQNEVEAGVAIYYVNRKKYQEWSNEQSRLSLERFFAKYGSEEKVIPAKSRVKSEPSTIIVHEEKLAPVENGYAAAINAAISEGA